MIKSIQLQDRKGMIVCIFLIISILTFISGCKKTVSDQIIQNEDIKLSEISVWGNWYQKTYPNAPKLLIAKAEKIFFKNRFYVRVPLKGSTGMIYFGKTESLEAVFIRINPNNGTISYPFTGNYEFIDLNKFTYKQITFIKGKANLIFQNVMAVGRIGESSSSKVRTNNSWFSQLLYCIATYLFVVPAKEGNDWTGCWVLGGGRSAEVQSVQVGDSGGGIIDWASFFYNIIPPLTGPDPIPPGGGGGWSAYTPPSYIPPSISYNDLSQLGLPESASIFYDFAEAPFVWTYTGDNNETFNDPDPSKNPYFQFLANDNYETLYPKFTSLIKNLKTFVVDNPVVMSALQKWSGLPKQNILNHLTYGQGAIIKVEEMGGRFAYYNRDSGTSTLHVRASYVRGLENAQLQSTKQATAFLLAVSILHEFCHYGTAVSNKSEGKMEFGYEFENNAFNIIVDDDNAGKVIIKFSQYF